MTYGELLTMLQAMSADRLQDNATINLDGEFYPVKDIVTQQGNDVLDDGHIYLDVQS